MVERQSGHKPLQNLVAGLMILGMLACLGVVVLAGNEINRDLGPNALAVAPDGRLYVASHGKVHVFSAENRREAAFDLAAMGAERIPSDLAVRADGRLLVADPPNARLAVCDLAKAVCDGRELGLAGWTPAHLMPGNPFKFSLDEARGRIYISDNGGHRLVIADATGKVLARTEPSREVIFPNQLHSHAPGELTVADTNHSRIATFDVAGDAVGRVLREFPVAGTGVTRPGRAWPFGMARLDDGSFWVLIARDGMKDADVVLFDPKGKAVRRIEAGDHWDPFAIALWKGAVVVADARNYRLHAFDPAGGNLRRVSDPGFESELRAIEARADAWRNYRFYATMGIAAFPIVGILVLWRMGVPLTAPGRAPIARPSGAKGDPPPPGPGIAWIEADPAYAAQQVKVIWFAIVMIVGTFVAFGIVIASLGASKPLTPMRIATLGAYAVVALSTLWLMARGLRDVRRRIASLAVGASPRGFHLRALPWHGIGEASVRGPFPWADVYFDGRKLLAGPNALQVKTPMGAEMFPRAAFEREILARIPKANYVSAATLGWRALRLAPPALKVVYGLAAIALILTILRT